MAFRYNLIKNGESIPKNSIKLEEDVINPWQKYFDKFNGSFSDCHQDEQGNSIDYTIEKIDLAPQEAIEQSNNDAREAAKTALASVKDILEAAKALDNSPEKAVIKDLAKAVLQIAKVINAANPLDSES
jgi:hypothetical protein